MTLLLLKLLLTPLLILLVTWVGRAYGPRVTGLVTGLPLTSGPVSLFLFAEHGRAFAARAAIGTIVGVVGVVAFCAGYGWAAQRARWPLALAAGAASFLGAAALLQWRPLTLATASLVALAVSIAAYATAGRAPASAAPSPRKGPAVSQNLPFRLVVATGLVASITMLARFVGPGWSGVISALPVFTAVLAVFTHRTDGSAAAAGLLSGVSIGSIGAQAFFVVVGLLLASTHAGVVYAVAVVCALAMNVLLGRERKPRLVSYAGGGRA